ncbi:transglycosylase SLT domain-containing protein [Streptomyces sp. RB6PN25]|uniref:Transglycosylase SLT domain-containing protein n=1 Tax=Streptomyces humicola TaxID=2953240 RepID=A0ABT1PS68_9ACTN|nr:transglycosylase SLT domain-containing protein [Streptomyces humicola]MCQ4079973.1 transglycosylase SLT domain-containing protein [Streptomyces humicola]
MQRPTTPTTRRMAKARKFALSGIAAAGLTVLAATVAAPSASAAPRAHGNVDAWIKQSLAIMHKKGIPGSYDGIKRNLMRESNGNPQAINNWDSNAKKGIPSKGLLQVIDPTFKSFHVAGTSNNIYDPVANITAAANYAAHKYGSIDKVNSAY